MGQRFDEIMHLVHNVCEEENLRVTLSSSLKNGVAAGVGGFIGCLLGGPWGGVPGAAIGAAIAAATGDNFRPLWQVIAEWPDTTKRELANNIEIIMQRVNATDVVALAAIVTGTGGAALRTEIAGAIIEYCRSEMNLNIGGGWPTN